MSVGQLAAGSTPAERPARRARTAPAERPWIRLVAFVLLALYGSVHFSTLLSPSPEGRLVGAIAVATALAAIGRMLRKDFWPLALLLTVAGAVAILAIAGVPSSWLISLRFGLIAKSIGNGLGALPGALVPYIGLDAWIRAVILLGGSTLILAAGAVLAFAPRPLTQPWRAAAALPLVVLAGLPTAFLHPKLPYLQGLALLALLVLIGWGERVARSAVPRSLALALLIGAGAMILAPALDSHHPWISPTAIAGQPAAAKVEQFDFSQRYGPLNWPRSGRTMFEVSAARPDYWKVQNLDAFDGRGWMPGAEPATSNLPGVDPAALRRFTQTITVTMGGMQTGDVIGAGFALSPPQGLGRPVQPGLGPGTWTAPVALHPGDSYRLTTYSPQPTAAELAEAGTDYPNASLAGDRSLEIPTGAPQGVATPVLFPPFHQGSTAFPSQSPYVPAYSLAGRLAAAAPTPYAFVNSVLGYLSHGYRYDERPPISRLPLLTFLFTDKRGYCQQFSGAMALLLRMGGIPARVVGGFTSGVYNGTDHRWVVSDLDAHAWVEAWFPGYGWVRFDPTPTSAPARARTTISAPARHRRAPSAPPRRAPSHHRPAPPVPRTATRTHVAPGAGLSPLAWISVGLLVVVVVGLVLFQRARPRGPESLVAELDRALARCGQPVPAGRTLAELERGFHSSPGAAAYVRSLRTARYGFVPAVPTQDQRRALRAQLRAGLGPMGWPRALWALPPRRLPPPPPVGPAYTS